MHTLLAIVFLLIAVFLIENVPGHIWAGIGVVAIMAILTVAGWYVLWKVIEKILNIALKIKR